MNAEFIEMGGNLRAAGNFTDHDEVGFICNECGMEMPGSAECNIHAQHTQHTNFKRKGEEKDIAAIKKMIGEGK